MKRFSWATLLFVARNGLAIASPEGQPDASHSLVSRALPIGTCNAQTPCPNGACCGTNGLCGYSPTECGSGNCTSNCDAKAECGQYGKPGSQNCPLNVCCSQFGFCGSTDDFCGTGCQQGFGGCGPPPTPPCGGSGVGKRNIGYYESWASTRTCQSVSPEQLNLDGYTHVNFAFAYFDPSSFAISPMDPNSASLYHRFTALKDKYSGLQTWISVGGWSFTDPGATREAFSNMASTSANRQQFISGLLQFMNTYGFDGVDLDWEYPQADDRGGQSVDTENYVALASDLRAALGSKGLSLTLPTSYWYLRHFDLVGLQKSVDWFNLMAYDLHGTWDAQSMFVGPYIAPHTNLTEIDLGLDLLWRAGLDANKVVLGQGYYGRSFTLSDPSCNTPNGVCQFSGGANPGPCSGTSGILDDQEIADIITQNNLQPTWDHTAGVKWITWDNNQWVSYDDADTLAQKKSFAQSRCLGGLMVWAIDQRDQTGGGPDGLGAMGPAGTQLSPPQQSDAAQMATDQKAQQSCYTSDCNAKCKKGTNKVTQMNGQPGQLSTSDRCPKNQYRTLCCDDGTTLGKCQWRGFRGNGLSCVQGCLDGETEMVTDTNNHNGKNDQTCNGGLQSYCCTNFKPPPTKAQLEQQAAEAAKNAAEAAAEQKAIDLAAKALCRAIIIPLFSVIEGVSDVVPIFGEIADLIEGAVEAGVIQACIKGVEKEGKAVVKVKGKPETITPGERPPQTRPPSSSHSPLSTSADDCNGKRAPDCRRQGPPYYEQTASSTSLPPLVTSYCNYAAWPQPCLHYSSVINHVGAARKSQYETLYCPERYDDSPRRPWVTSWSKSHVRDWYIGQMQIKGLKCQADEYPPAAYWQSLEYPKRYIRFNPGTQNTGAGSMFHLDHCGYDDSGNLPNMRVNEHAAGKRVIDGLERSVTQFKKEVRQGRMSVEFNNDDVEDDGLTANPCWPSRLVYDPGFALLIDDSWYQGIQGGADPDLRKTRNKYKLNYSNLVPQDIYSPPYYRKRDEEDHTSDPGQVRPHYRKRDPEGHALDPDNWVHSDGNSTRAVTDEELERDLGIIRCGTPDCEKEMEILGVQSAIVEVPSTALDPSPAQTTATSTDAAEEDYPTPFSRAGAVLPGSGTFHTSPRVTAT